MTRRDYLRLSRAFHDAYKQAEHANPQSAAAGLTRGVLIAANFVAVTLASDNPRFDRDRFLNACLGVVR